MAHISRILSGQYSLFVKHFKLYVCMWMISNGDSKLHSWAENVSYTIIEDVTPDLLVMILFKL